MSTARPQCETLLCDTSNKNKLFSFLFLNLDKVLENWTPGKIDKNIWQIEWLQKDTIKFDRMQIHFLATFSLLLSSSLL